MLAMMWASAATPEGRRLAGLRTFFYQNQHLLPGALEAVAMTPLPAHYQQLLNSLETSYVQAQREEGGEAAREDSRDGLNAAEGDGGSGVGGAGDGARGERGRYGTDEDDEGGEEASGSPLDGHEGVADGVAVASPPRAAAQLGSSLSGSSAAPSVGWVEEAGEHEQEHEEEEEEPGDAAV